MQLGKSLIGAAVGGALGIGLLVVVYLLGIRDYSWLAIPVALLTGLGVRWMVATYRQPSYARGALTGVLALAAFVLGNYVVAQVAMRQALAARAPAEGGDDSEQVDGDNESRAAVGVDMPIVPVRDEQRMAGGDLRMRVPARAFSTMDFIWLSVAALVAYELGRGSGSATTQVVAEARNDDDAESLIQEEEGRE